jgi:hypothetical protein
VKIVSPFLLPDIHPIHPSFPTIRIKGLAEAAHLAVQIQSLSHFPLLLSGGQTEADQGGLDAALEPCVSVMRLFWTPCSSFPPLLTNSGSSGWSVLLKNEPPPTPILNNGCVQGRLLRSSHGLRQENIFNFRWKDAEANSLYT